MMPKLPLLRSAFFCFLGRVTCGLALVWGGLAQAQSVQSTVSVGQGPVAVDVNPVTNKIYVANIFGSSISVMDGLTNGVTNVPVGASPWGVAINPVTNKIYSADGAGDVTVIDGATNTTTTIAISAPEGIVLNPLTNMIYVLQPLSNQVSVIDGATNTVTAHVATGNYPTTLAINPVTNKIYVANTGTQGAGNTVTVIDGATNITATVTVGNNPVAIAVNPATNKIYVANSVSNTVTVIDGASNTTATTPTGANPIAVAVDTVLNVVYVANSVGNTVTVINGGTNGARDLAGFTQPYGVEVNEVTGQVFVADVGGNGAVTVIDEASFQTVTLPTGASPEAIAINPVTNKAYVANRGDYTVTVIDGAVNKVTAQNVGNMPDAVAYNPVRKELFTANYSDNTVSAFDVFHNILLGTLPTGTNPEAVVVNPVTNMVYVANSGAGGITAFDSVTGAFVTIDPADTAQSVAVNPVTNKIYAASGSKILVIDGSTNAFVAVPTTGGPGPAAPHSIGVNPVTNKVYVADGNESKVLVLDGATNTLTSVSTGLPAFAIDVDAVTNKIYVANYPGSTVTVLDGATNSTTTVNVGISPTAIAVNSQTNTIYVANEDTGTVTVINGASNTFNTLTGFLRPRALLVDPLLNLVYVANSSNGTTSVIDGVTNTVLSKVTTNTNPYDFALDLFNDSVYQINATTTGDVSEIAPNVTQTVPLTTVIVPVVDANTVGLDNVFQTTSHSPDITVYVESDFIQAQPYNSVDPTPKDVYYRVDGGSGPWNKTTLLTTKGNLATFDVQLANIPAGLHVLYAFADYGNESGMSASTNSNGSATRVGNTTACYFLVTTSGTPATGTPPPCVYGLLTLPSPTTMTLTCVPPTIPVGGTAMVTATVANSFGTGTPTGTVSFTDNGAALLTEPLLGGMASLTYTGTILGVHTLTATYMPIGNFTGSTASCTVTVEKLPTVSVLTLTPSTPVYGTPSTLTATVTPKTPPGPSAPTGTVTFYNGTMAIGTAPVAAIGGSGVGSIQLSLVQGVGYNLTCMYNGDPVYDTSNCNTIPISPSTFTIALDPSTITLPSSVTGTVKILLGSVGGFAGPLALTYSSLPANATASISPTTVTLTAGGTGSSTLTLNTVLLAASDRPVLPGRNRMPEVFAAVLLLALPFGLARQRKMRWIAAAMVAAGLMGMTGCTNSWYIRSHVAPGTYQIPVTATDVDGNSKTAVLTVIVTPS